MSSPIESHCISLESLQTIDGQTERQTDRPKQTDSAGRGGWAGYGLWWYRDMQRDTTCMRIRVDRNTHMHNAWTSCKILHRPWYSTVIHASFHVCNTCMHMHIWIASSAHRQSRQPQLHYIFYFGTLVFRIYVFMLCILYNYMYIYIYFLYLYIYSNNRSIYIHIYYRMIFCYNFM